MVKALTYRRIKNIRECSNLASFMAKEILKLMELFIRVALQKIN